MRATRDATTQTVDGIDQWHACPQCGSPDVGVEYWHVMRIGSGAVFRCDDCHRYHEHRLGMDMHMEEPPENWLRCPTCKSRDDATATFLPHMPISESIVSYFCESCGTTGESGRTNA